MWEDLRERHEQLKKRIHAFRIPLSPNGQRVMKVVYFSIPLIGGYFIMEAAMKESEKNMIKYKIGSNPNLAHKKDLREQNQALQVVLNKYKSSVSSSGPNSDAGTPPS